MSDTYVPALMAAHALALSARTNQLTLHMVDDTRSKAEQLLPRGHAVRTAVVTFCTMYEEHRRDAEQMRKQGEYLADALGRALNPDAPDPRRSIVYGGTDD